MPEKIKEILNDTLDKLGLVKKLKEKQVLSLWSEIIGPKIKLHTEAKYINKGTLFVTVDNSTWAHQLLFMKRKLINKLNKRLEQEIIKDIRFKVGKISHFGKGNSQSSFSLDNIQLKPEEKEKLDQIAKSISDPELKTKFLNLLEVDYKKKKWQKNNDWDLCPDCSVLISPEQEKCAICTQKEGETDRGQIKKVLSNTPWLDYEQIIKGFPKLTKAEFEVIKEEVSSELKFKIDELLPKALKEEVDPKEVRVIIQNYVMLKTEVPPGNLTDRLIKEIIGENKMKIYKNL